MSAPNEPAGNQGNNPPANSNEDEMSGVEQYKITKWQYNAADFCPCQDANNTLVIDDNGCAFRMIGIYEGCMAYYSRELGRLSQASTEALVANQQRRMAQIVLYQKQAQIDMLDICEVLEQHFAQAHPEITTPLWGTNSYQSSPKN